MAIVKVDPLNWEELNINAVQLDSDAPDNYSAVDDINDWADEHGFVRANELYLRVFNRQNGRVYRGICYRDTEEDQLRILERIRAHEKHLESLPVTAHTAR